MKTEKNIVNEIKHSPIKEIGFFKRIQVSIFKVENYGEFILERTRIAVRYFFLLLFLVSIIMSLVSTYQINKMIIRGISYIKNEMPDFSLSEGEMKFAVDTEAYDEEMDFYVLYATKSDISDEHMSEIEDKMKDYTTALVYLPDRLVLYDGFRFGAYKYSDLVNEFNIKINDKESLVNFLDTVGALGIDVTYFISFCLIYFLRNIIDVGLNLILVFCFGIIASKFCGISMPNSKVFSISIYSITLSVLLSAVYGALYTLASFYIPYFEIMYILIAYIYLVAALLIIKSDIIKQKVELQKVIEVEKQVKKEIEEQKEEEKEDNKKDDTDSDGEKKKDSEKEKDKNKKEDESPILNREPDGSEI